MLIEGQPRGSEGTPSHLEVRLVVLGGAAPRYMPIEMTSDISGEGRIDLQPGDTEVYVVITAVPEHFTGNQTYGYRVQVSRE